MRRRNNRWRRVRVWDNHARMGDRRRWVTVAEHDRDTLDVGGQADHDGADRTPDHSFISHDLACLLTISDPEVREEAIREVIGPNGPA